MKQNVPKPRNGLSLHGTQAQAFLDQYPVRRDDLGFTFTNRIGTFFEDPNMYFEVGDGRIFGAHVTTKMTDYMRINGARPEDLPSVRVVEIWPDEDTVKRRRDQGRKDLEIGVQGRHLLKEVTSDRPDFPDDLPFWKERIASYLDLYPAQLDGTRASLREIDRASKKKKVSQKDFFEHLYGPLVGYIGEVIRLAAGGHWLMRPDSEVPSVWIPVIVTAEGRAISWYSQMWDLADEQYRNFSCNTVIAITTDNSLWEVQA